MANVVRLLDFIDKLDDIIYEPVKMLCDYARQPMKDREAIREQRQLELNQKLRQEMAQFDVDLEHRRNLAAADALAYERELNEKVNDMIARSEIERNTAIVEAIKNYQLEMADAAKSISESIGRMNLDLRERAQNLIIEKTKEYKQIQTEAKKEAKEELLQVAENFAEGSKARDIMEDAICTQLKDIIDTTSNFIRTMENDMKNIYANIDNITSTTLGQSQDILSALSVKTLNSSINKQISDKQ